MGLTRNHPSRIKRKLGTSETSASVITVMPVIPTPEARVLFAAANQPKKLLTFPGAGHNVFGSVGDPYLKLVEDFIREALKSPE